MERKSEKEKIKDLGILIPAYILLSNETMKFFFFEKLSAFNDIWLAIV